MQALLAHARARPLRAGLLALVGVPLIVFGSPVLVAIAIFGAPVLVPTLLFVAVSLRYTRRMPSFSALRRGPRSLDVTLIALCRRLSGGWQAAASTRQQRRRRSLWQVYCSPFRALHVVMQVYTDTFHKCPSLLCLQQQQGQKQRQRRRLQDPQPCRRPL